MAIAIFNSNSIFHKNVIFNGKDGKNGLKKIF